MSSEETADGRPQTAEAGQAASGEQQAAENGELSPDSGDNSSEAVEQDLDALLVDVQRERDEYLQLAQRARADFENFRKRAASEAADAEKRGKTSIARDLIPVIDNLDRALAAATADDPLRKGVELVRAELVSALQRAGVAAYDPQGEAFDPNLHEALATRPEEGADSGAVLETVELGYRLDGQVIRAARVVVAE
jgi:molecular chaperone GrpE